MKRRVITPLLTSLALLSLTAAHAQENELKVDLQMLTHGELRNGGITVVEEDNESKFVLGRERLIIDYSKKGLATRLNIQHMGIWGQSGKGAFNVYEAWARMTSRQGLFAQVGRVALAYDDERIIGVNDWAVASLSHDVLRLGYEGHGHKLHAIFAYNQNANVLTEGGNFYEGGAQPYKSMQMAWYHYDVPEVPLGVSLLAMNIGMQSGEKDKNPHTEYQQLLGAYVNYKPKYWTVEGSYYKQMGHEENGLKLDAWMASLKAIWSPQTRYSVEAGYDYLSGDKNFAVPAKGTLGMVRHDAVRGFNPIYGSHHKFYGAMDFFYVSTYIFGFTPGLQNAYAGFSYKPISPLSLKTSYHYLAIAADLQDIDKTLGHEIELEASYRFSSIISLSAGFSYMTGTETMEKLKRTDGDGSLRWGWFSLVIKPRIFSTRW